MPTPKAVHNRHQLGFVAHRAPLPASTVIVRRTSSRALFARFREASNTSRLTLTIRSPAATLAKASGTLAQMAKANKGALGGADFLFEGVVTTALRRRGLATVL